MIREGNSELQTDPDVVNSLVAVKYRKLFRDSGSKERYLHGNTITLSKNDVTYALEYASDKAVSWDLIPGKVLMSIKDRTDLHSALASMLNEILLNPVRYQEIFTARLICLNKEAEKPGNID